MLEGVIYISDVIKKIVTNHKKGLMVIVSGVNVVQAASLKEKINRMFSGEHVSDVVFYSFIINFNLAKCDTTEMDPHAECADVIVIFG